MKIKSLIRPVLLFLLVIALITGIIMFLFYFGALQINNPSRKSYPIRGVDVSSYQGDISWEILSKEGIDFAFIKATEGSGFTDKKFSYNWEAANKTQLKVGAYHFFSFDSSGKSQAEHFIATVPKIEGVLPPVIDVEFYGDKQENPTEKELVQKELRDMIDALKIYYEKEPILYFTEESYELYLKDSFSESMLWARGVYGKVDYMGSSNWHFWQYSNRKRLKGYSGKEVYIDMNLFNGELEEFELLSK